MNQNSRGLHKPKLRKMPQHIQDEYNREEYLKKMERLHSSPPGHEGKASRSPLQDKRQYGYQQQELQHHQRLNESPTTIDPRSTTKSEKSTSSQAAVAGISTEKGRLSGPRKKITAKMLRMLHLRSDLCAPLLSGDTCVYICPIIGTSPILSSSQINCSRKCLVCCSSCC